MKRLRNLIGVFGWPERVVPFDLALTEGRAAVLRLEAAAEGVWRSLSSSYPEIAARLLACRWSHQQTLQWLLTRSSKSAPPAELLLAGRCGEVEEHLGRNQWDIASALKDLSAEIAQHIDKGTQPSPDELLWWSELVTRSSTGVLGIRDRLRGLDGR